MEHLNWIIAELEKRPVGTVYLDHEYFDYPIALDLETAIKIREELINDREEISFKGRERVEGNNAGVY